MFLASAAHADEPVATPTPTTPTVAVKVEDAPPPRMVKQWYGWQTLIADGAAIGLGFATRGNPWVTGAAYSLVPTVIHFTHGNVGRGFADLGIRVVLPPLATIGGGLLGLALAQDPGGSGAGKLNGLLIGAGLGLITGYVGAVTIDAAALSWETVPADSVAPKAKERASSLRLAPTFAVSPEKNGGSAVAGLGGAF